MTRISRFELKGNAKQKLESAKKLQGSNCFNDSVYLAGYSIELALKYKFCEKLNIDFPEDLKDIKLKTHNLGDLLYISGESNFDNNPDWAVVKSIQWSEKLIYSSNPETKQNAENMIDSCENLLIQLNII
jgi:HEPN domain-containing protein